MIGSELVRETKVPVISMGFLLAREEGKCKVVVIQQEKVQCGCSVPTSWETPAEELVFCRSSVGSQGAW